MTTDAASGVLVTGAAGFLGRHLCRHLVCARFTDRVVALDSTPATPDDPEIECRLTRVVGDVRDSARIARALDGVRTVFHLAGVADPRACERDPSHAHAVNVGGTAALVDAAVGRRVVLLSSAVVYDASDVDAVDELAPVAANGIYAATKLAAEHVCLEATAAGRIAAVVVRNFNTYGGGQGGVFLIPELVARGLREGRVEVANCRPVRDFMHVDDTIAALVAVAAVGRAGEIYNVGSGRGFSVGDVALALGRILGVPVSCAHGPPTGPAKLVAVNTKLREETGWSASIDLADGLTRTVEAFRKVLSDR